MVLVCFIVLGLTYHCLCVASLGRGWLWLSHSDERYCICLWLVKHFDAFCGSIGDPEDEERILLSEEEKCLNSNSPY